MWSIASIFVVSSTASVWVTGFWACAASGSATSTASAARVFFICSCLLNAGARGPRTQVAAFADSFFDV